MRIGIRAHDMENLPLEERAQIMKSQGFLCTQLALKKAINTFNVKPEAMTPGMACYIKDIFQQNKVDIAVLGCYLNLANPDKKELANIMYTYKSHIRFANTLGCGVVGTETGAVNTEYVYEKANHSDTALNIFIENLKIIVEYAEKIGVIIGIEPVYKHIVSDLDRTYRVLTAIDSPNLQIILDPVNLLSYDNYKNQDEIVKGAFELFNKDIAVIHAKDFEVIDKEIVAVPCGKGLFNHGLFMELIKEHKPYVHVLLENTNPTNAVVTKEFIENIYQNASI